MSTMPGGGWRRSMTNWRARTGRRRCAARRRRCSKSSTRRSGTRRVGFLRLHAGRREAPGAVRRVEPRALSLFRYRAARACRARRGQADGIRHELPAGASARCRRCIRRTIRTCYQRGSVWPHDNAHHRRRLQALRLRHRGRADRPRHLRRGEPFRAPPVARAVCRHRARRHHLPGAVSRRQRAASLGRRLGLHAVAGAARDRSRTRRAACCMSTRRCRIG